MEATDDLNESSFHGEKTRMESRLKREWRGGTGDSERRRVLFGRFVVGRDAGEEWSQKSFFLVVCFVCFLKMKDIKPYLKVAAYDPVITEK